MIAFNATLDFFHPWTPNFSQHRRRTLWCSYYFPSCHFIPLQFLNYLGRVGELVDLDLGRDLSFQCKLEKLIHLLRSSS